jgi:hypothetical protein
MMRGLARPAPHVGAATAVAGAPPLHLWGLAGFTAMATAITLKSTWATLESQDPALLPGTALGPAVGAATFSQWPAAQGGIVQLAFLLARPLRLPVLLAHIHLWNWCVTQCLRMQPTFLYVCLRTHTLPRTTFLTHHLASTVSLL